MPVEPMPVEAALAAKLELKPPIEPAEVEVLRAKEAAAPAREAQHLAAKEQEELELDAALLTLVTREEREDEELAAIGVWQGYWKQQFVLGRREEGVDYALAVSPYFRVPGGTDPERTESSEQALETLLSNLQGEGWRVVGEGPSWWGRRLARPVTAGVAGSS
jgi:hypothetical protein